VKVIWTQDIIFNEDEVFNSNMDSESIKENIQNIPLEEFAKMLEKIEEPSKDKIELATQQKTHCQSIDSGEEVGQTDNQALGLLAEEALKELEYLSAYPIPLESPTVMFTSAISSPEGIKKKEASNIIFELECPLGRVGRKKKPIR
jgi:hypothetical protein